MEALFAAAKVGKYASSESGDTVEMVERPGGGVSFVLVDGQMSGRSAKAIANVVARKAISLLADGVRDGAAARAASDYLFTYRQGKVSATLNILSVDFYTKSLVITRNNHAPAILVREHEISLLDAPSDAVGTRRGIRPRIQEISLEPNLAAVLYSDGLVHAGDREGKRVDVHHEIQYLIQHAEPSARVWADHLLSRAIELDHGRPIDDISVLVALIIEDGNHDIRRMSVDFPITC